jgi:hypothetical protein
MAVGDVVLAVFAEIAAVGINDRGGVVVDAGHFDFVDGDDEGHLVLLRELLHKRDGWPVWDFFGQFVPAGLLLGAEVGTVEKFLEAEDLYFLFGGIGDEVLMLGDHLFLDVGERKLFRGPLTLGLNQATANRTSHATPPRGMQAKSLPRAGSPNKAGEGEGDARGR